MKYKKLLFLIPLLICCGWTSNYNLKYNGKEFEETLTYNFEDSVYNLAKQYENIEEGEFFEVNLISEDIYASPTQKYKKTFSDDNRTVTLTAKYNLNEFKDSYQITSCFENYKLNKTNKKYEIDLSGDYYCDEFSVFDFTTKSYNMIESNASEVSEDLYRWYLNTNSTIHIVLRDNSEIINIILYVVPIVLVLLMLFLIIIIKNKRANG